jgi:hypothetical protein
MKTLTSKFMIGIAVTALFGAVLWAMQAGADIETASSLGPNWECRKLSRIRICEQITQNVGKRLPASCRAVGT